MKPTVEIFEIDFGRTEILLMTLIPVFINVAIFFYISFVIQRTLITYYFSSFVIILALWQAFEGTVKMCITLQAAEAWNQIAQIFLVLVILFGLLFALHFTKLDKKIFWNVLFPVLVLPVLFFIICIVLHFAEYAIVSSANWYWVVNPKPTLITTCLYLWVSIGGVLILTLFWLNYFKQKKANFERTQSLLLAIGFTIPCIIGIIVEVLFPMVFNIDGVPITVDLATIFSILSLIAIKKYRMLDFSPKHQWDQIVSYMGEGILILNNNSEIKYANEAFCKLLGYEFSEIEDKNATNLFFSSDDDKEKSKERIELRKQGFSSQNEVEVTTKTGEKKWVLIGGSPYVDKDGNIIGSTGIFADISERKAVEKNLIAANKELEIFIYKASHDLRGPLASIIGLVNVSKFEIQDPLANKYLDMIETSTQKLDNTLKELVKTIKIKDTERLDDKIDFKEIIDTILKEFEFFNDFSRLKISSTISISAPFYSNKFIIETIFQNLIENAIKYQNKLAPESYLNIKVEDHKDGIQIVFEDNGIGIKSSIQGLIFDMYFKAVETSKGSGLGLYLVKKCVDKLGGTINLKSSYGKGTEFTIILNSEK